ncbi:MAG: hypothetical protein ACR2MT_05235 [Aurantibacter sp.]
MKNKIKEVKTIRVKLSEESILILNQKSKSASSAVWFVENPSDPTEYKNTV